MAKQTPHILALARRGAEVRFRELIDELKFLTLSFPHLEDAVDQEDLPVNYLLQRGRDKARALDVPKRRRKMSAAARQAIGDAQRARWTKRRSGKK
jgi:hypothetical protein